MSSKINLQTCEYACKSSIFQDNQLIYQKSGKKAVLKFKGVSKADGYQIVYSTDKKMKKKCTTITTKSKKYTLKKLSKKKTYYVKVRAYRIDSTGKMKYGKYTSVSKVKINK